MSIGSYDLHKGIASLWDTSGLDDEHTVYWSNADTAAYPTLQEAGSVAPGTPFPYTVFEEGTSYVVARSSGADDESSRIIREVPIMFRVRARHRGTGEDAKTISSNIAQAIMAVFGPHPTTAQSTICLDTGGVIRIQYQFDRSVVEDEETHSMYLSYHILLDIPVET